MEDKIQKCRDYLMLHDIQFTEDRFGVFDIYKAGKKVIQYWAVPEVIHVYAPHALDCRDRGFKRLQWYLTTIDYVEDDINE